MCPNVALCEIYICKVLNQCCRIDGPPYHCPPPPPQSTSPIAMVDPHSTLPRTDGPRGSTYSRMSEPPPEQVDPHLLGIIYRSYCKLFPDG